MAPYDPLAHDTPNRLHPPSSQFWLDTDIFGRDSFSRIVFASRVSLYVGLISVFLGSVIESIVGVASGVSGRPL